MAFGTDAASRRTCLADPLEPACPIGESCRGGGRPGGAGAGRRRGPRAPRLYVEAGRARLLAGQTEAGMTLLKTRLWAFAAVGHQYRPARIGQRLVTELEQGGFQAEAGEIRALLASLGWPPAAAHDKSNAASKAQLPTHCQDCGAPVRPDELEWLDNATAACDYAAAPSGQPSGTSGRADLLSKHSAKRLTC